MRTLGKDGAERVLDVSLDVASLLAIAREGGFFSHVAGTAATMIKVYASLILRGGPAASSLPPAVLPPPPPLISIVVTKSTLPICVGMSSSAAVCVLVVLAFAAAFDLPCRKDRDEVRDLAYRGERETPSRCGRMDQVACAYGAVEGPIYDGDGDGDGDGEESFYPSSLHGSAHPNGEVQSEPFFHVTFDGTHAIKVDAILPPPNFKLHLLLVDLCASKDTKMILTSLQSAYPFPSCAAHSALHSLLGPDNLRVQAAAAAALKAGDAPALGRIMNQAQDLFDEKARPLCREQLESPKLHAVIGSLPVRNMALGAKGVGSQGDGMAQILVNSEAEGTELASALIALFGDIKIMRIAV